MIKLLRANFARLLKNKLFLLSLVAILVITLYYALNCGREAERWALMGYYGQDCLDLYYFNFFPFMGIFPAVIISFMLGTEYSCGTVRNKIIEGHTRKSVYAANLITSIVASAAMWAVYFIGGLAGLFMLPRWKMGTQEVVLYVIIAFFLISALSSVFTLIGMLSASKPATAVTCLLIFLVLLLSGAAIYNRICEPETLSGVVITAQGMEMQPPSPNPRYVSGIMRSVLQTALEILPTGQAILLANLEASRPVFYIASSAGIIFVTTIIGMGVFDRKDLK